MSIFSELNPNILILVVFILVFITWFILGIRFYKRRGFFIGICRLIWIIPILLCLFPREKVVKVKTDFVNENISVLVDDSISMIKSGYDYKSKLKELENLCELRGCSLNIDYLSQIHSPHP